MDYEALYTDLGYLFYSIAASDGKISSEERAALSELIRKQWLPLENSRDEMGTDEGHYIDIAFDYARDACVPPDEAFERFADHVRREPDQFDAGLRRMVLQSAADIASVTRRMNKSELTRLNQLEALFRMDPSPWYSKQVGLDR